MLNVESYILIVDRLRDIPGVRLAVLSFISVATISKDESNNSIVALLSAIFLSNLELLIYDFCYEPRINIAEPLSPV